MVEQWDFRCYSLWQQPAGHSAHAFFGISTSTWCLLLSQQKQKEAEGTISISFKKTWERYKQMQ